MPAGPDARRVDAAAAAVGRNAIDQQVEIIAPPVYHIVAEQNLREARSVHLHAGVAAVLIDRCLPTEHHAASAFLENRGADVVLARVDRDRFTRHAGREERLGDAIRRPRFLGTRLQHQTKLQRNDRKPQRVHARRVRRQHQAEHRTLRLIADRHAALFAMTVAKHVEIQFTGERRQNASHLGEHEPVLLHVGASQRLWQPGRGRLRTHELLWRLRSVAHRQGAVQVQLAGLGHAVDQFANRHRAKHIARLLRLAHVALHQATVGAADTRHGLAGREVRHFVDLHARIGLPPPEGWDV